MPDVNKEISVRENLTYINQQKSYGIILRPDIYRYRNVKKKVF